MISTIFWSAALEYKFFKSPNGLCNLFFCFFFFQEEILYSATRILKQHTPANKTYLLYSVLVGGFYCI